MINIKNQRVLILEDSQERIDIFNKNLVGNEFVIVSNASECIHKLVKEKWDVLFLDHDLDGRSFVDSLEDNTGYQVAKFLNQNKEYKPKVIVIHSLNPAGAKNMQMELPEAYRIPFAWSKINK